MEGDALALTATAPAAQRRRDAGYWFDIVVGRLLPALVFSLFVVLKLVKVGQAASAAGQHPGGSASLNLVTQALGLGYFVLIVLLYVFRLPRRAGDARPAMVAVAFFGTFSILFVGFLPGAPRREALVLLGDSLVLAGSIYALWALIYLRRSFSILPDARRLVTGGPYSLSRHPLYLAEAAAAIGLMLPAAGWMGAVVILLFLAAQYHRLRTEESVLTGQFPEYAAYADRVPRYLPDPRLAWRREPRG